MGRPTEWSEVHKKALG
uniref:Uncharacterized protein n=1 Tax=Arundo donax TaxID=35708 RepID=A0A0A9C0P1_ARUDO